MPIQKARTPAVRKRHQDSLPGLVNMEDLEPGDILLFRPPEKLSFTQKLLMFMQALTRQKHGHYDTTHAAICVSNENNKPIIAHISSKYKSRDGYVNEPLSSYLTHSGEPAFILFRPPVDAAPEIAAVADHSRNYGSKWSFFTSVARFLQKAKPGPKDAPLELPQKISRDTVASKFVTECIQIGMENSGNHKGNINIRSNSSPKALESALYNNKHFEIHCYLDPKAFDKLDQEIKAHLKRFYAEDTRGGIGSKHLKVSQVYLDAKFKLEENKHLGLNEMQKCLFLLDAVLPSLKESTGLGIFETTSHRAVTGLARKMGIFQRDIDEYSRLAHPKDSQVSRHKKNV